MLKYWPSDYTDMFPHTSAIHPIVSRNVETVALLPKLNTHGLPKEIMQFWDGFIYYADRLPE